ncbi:MAG: glycosyltransferase, partial [Nostocoides sp.]
TDPLHATRSGRRPRAGRGLRPGPEVTRVRPGQLTLFEPTKWLPRRIDPRQDSRWARAAVRVAQQCGLDDPTLWVNDPRGAELANVTDWPLVHDITDDWLVAERPPAELARLAEQERILLHDSAVVVVCSPRLVVTKGARRPVRLITNGVDTAAYADPGPRPSDLPPARVALYVGTVHRDRIDLDLCEATARAIQPQGRLVLLGPAPLPSADGARLLDAGVVLLGSRPHDAVPSYLTHADVLVVPHRVTAFTDSLDPIKRYEYEAAGRPVVSTAVAGFREWPAATVAGAEDFPDAVRSALAEPAGAPATPIDHGLDWSNRVEAMQAVLDETRAVRRRLRRPSPKP